MTLRQWSEAKGVSVDGTPETGLSVLADYGTVIPSRLFELEDYEATDIKSSPCGRFTVKLRERAVWGDLG